MKDYSKQVEELLEQMTLEEKIGQLIQSGPSLVGGFTVPVEELFAMVIDGRMTQEEFQQQIAGTAETAPMDAIASGSIGSFLGITGSASINEAQKAAVEESRLGIPVLAGFDVIHGYKTVFPIPLAESCSWDPEIFEETARIAADEASAAGIHWVFAPMVDVARDARWGRVSEGAGEDPYLTSIFARAKVQGFQGTDLADKHRVIACPKHFIAYSGAEGGRDYNGVEVSVQQILNIFLSPFKAAMEVGALSMMPSFNTINGVPNTVNTELLNDLLKVKEGFKGALLSDAFAVNECVNHGVAQDYSEAAKLAINAGIDVEMISPCYNQHLKELVEAKQVSMDRIDDAVRRVLRMKFAKGLFDNPYQTDGAREKETLLKPEYVAYAREAALKSIVLLKNNEVLPLKTSMKVGLAGPLADMPAEMLGAWSIKGDAEDCISIRAGMEAIFENIEYEAGIKIKDSDLIEGDVDLKAVERLATNNDVLVVVAGETKEMSGEAACRSDLGLPGQQAELIRALKVSGKPVIVVLINGRPLALGDINDTADAIVEAWHLGIQAGHAVAAVLSGNENPSGKLSISFPENSGQCPVYYNHLNTGRPAGAAKFTSKYLDSDSRLRYPFGFGLSYTSFDYANLSAQVAEGVVKVSVDVSNTGKYDGFEIVQFYFQDVAASLARPVKQLFGFKKVWIKAGETVKVSLETPGEAFGFYNNQGKYCLEDGWFKIFVGKSSADTLETEVFLYVTP